ncbi:MAG: hypothetical protein WBK20_16085 [Spirochaetota bacterium]
MNKLAIRLLYIAAPFCIDVGFNGFIKGYTYLRFVKYTGIMGYTISSFSICLGIAGIYLYFWMIINIEGKNKITIFEVLKIIITSSFPYFMVSMLLFSYVSYKIYKFDYISYFSLSHILLLLCLYGQLQLEERLIRLIENKGIKVE